MKINLNNYKPFLMPGIILLLILVVTFTVFKPRFTLILKSQRQLASDRKILAGLTTKLATLEGLAKVEFNDKVNVALNVLPSYKDVPRNLLVIKKTALNNDLIIIDIAISDVGEIATASAKQKGGKGEVLPFFTINLTVNGEKERIKNFISQIEMTAPLTKVKKVSIMKRKSELPETNLEIQAFFLAFPQTLGKPEQQLVAITSSEEKVFKRINEFLSFEDAGVILPNLPVGKENLFTD